MVKENKMFLKRTLFSCGVTALLLGCGTLPASGPYGTKMNNDGNVKIDISSIQQGDKTLRYAVAEVNQSLLGFLAKYPAEASLDEKWPDNIAAEEITVNIGDTIQVSIFESQSGGLFIPEDSSVRPGNFVSLPSQTIDYTGKITVPYAGQVQAAGKTTEEISADIVQRLSNKAIEPQVVVSFSSREGAEVSVIGDVNNASRLSLGFNKYKMLDAIAEAGGPTSPGFETKVSLQRGEDEYNIRFDRLVEDSDKNIYAKINDIIYLYREPEIFIAYGAVENQGSISFGKRKLNLSEALGLASGLSDGRADPAEVYIYRQRKYPYFEKVASVETKSSNVMTTITGGALAYSMETLDVETQNSINDAAPQLIFAEGEGATTDVSNVLEDREDRIVQTDSSVNNIYTTPVEDVAQVQARNKIKLVPITPVLSPYNTQVPNTMGVAEDSVASTVVNEPITVFSSSSTTVSSPSVSPQVDLPSVQIDTSVNRTSSLSGSVSTPPNLQTNQGVTLTEKPVYKPAFEFEPQLPEAVNTESPVVDLVFDDDGAAEIVKSVAKPMTVQTIPAQTIPAQQTPQVVQSNARVSSPVKIDDFGHARPDIKTSNLPQVSRPDSVTGSIIANQQRVVVDTLPTPAPVFVEAQPQLERVIPNLVTLEPIAMSDVASTSSQDLQMVFNENATGLETTQDDTLSVVVQDYAEPKPDNNTPVVIEKVYSDDIDFMGERGIALPEVTTAEVDVAQAAPVFVPMAEPVIVEAPEVPEVVVTPPAPVAVKPIEPSPLRQPKLEVQKVTETATMVTTDEGVSMIFKLNMRDPKSFFLAQNFQMEDQDIIYVANAKSVEFSKFLNILNLSSTTTNTTDTAKDRF